MSIFDKLNHTSNVNSTVQLDEVDSSIENFLHSDIKPATITDQSQPHKPFYTGQTNSGEDAEDNDESVDRTPLYYKQVYDRDVLKHDWKLALAIDPSQNGSGIAIYDNRQGQEELTLLSSSLSKLKPESEPLRYEYMVKEYRNDLIEAVKTTLPDGTDPVFDMIIIEDTVMEHSAQIFKRLVLINHSLDHLIESGVLKTKHFVRVNNVTWKKWLYTYKNGKHYKNPKREIEDVLHYLKEPYVLDNYNQTKAWKKANQYQDKLDALSMMLVGKDVINDLNKPAKSTKHYHHEYKLVTSLTEQQQTQFTPLVLKDKSSITLQETIKALAKQSLRDPSYIPVTSTQLGNLAIQYNWFFPVGHSSGYLLIR